MNDTNIIIDYAKREDLPEIIAIYNSTVAGRMVTADLEPVTVESRIPWFEEHTPDKRPLWVMRVNDQIAGWVSLSSFYGRPAYDGTAEISVYVDEAFRGTGAGSRLLEKVIQDCPRLKITTVLAFVFGQNKPSLGLLQKFGFEKWGHYPEVAVLDDVKCDLVVLGKKVDD